MVLRKLFLTAILFLMPVALFGAGSDNARGSVSGVVIDRATRQPIALANVLAVGTTRGAAADLEGRFQIDGLELGTVTLQASALGYETLLVPEISVLSSRTSQVEFALEPSAIEGEEVVYSVAGRVSVSPDLPTSTRTLRYEEIRRAPGAAEDVQRMVQSLPGVVNQNDQNNEIVVRGGSPWENLTVMDGLEVDNTNHFSFEEGNGGPVNALNTEFLRDVTFASGGFSARYGDRLSSVLVLDLREGDRERYKGALDLNMAGAGGFVEGPTPGGNGSFLVSAHKSYLDLIQGPVGLTSIPHYWNAQGKFVQDLSPRHQLTINSLYTDDFIDIESDEEDAFSKGAEAVNYSGRRIIAGGRLRSLWGWGYSDLVAGQTVTWDHARVWQADKIEGQLVKKHTVDTDRRITQTQMHLQMNGRGPGRGEWSLGFSLKPMAFKQNLWALGDSLWFDDGVINRDPQGNPIVDGEPDLYIYNDRVAKVDDAGLAYGGYTQMTLWFGRMLSMTGGLRMDGLDVSHRAVLDPRFSLAWLFRSEWTLSLAGGVYHQFPTVSVLFGGPDRDRNSQLPPARALQAVAGISFEPTHALRFSAETYIKDYSDLLIGEQAYIRETSGDRTFQSAAYLPWKVKQAWGIEFFAQRRLTGSWYGTASYSYGYGNSSDPAFGDYPASYDIRHAATLVFGVKTSLIRYDWWLSLISKPWGWWLQVLPINGDELTISTRYRYVTGRPYTGNRWYEEGVPSPEPIYQGHWESFGMNDQRYPDYMRWDLRLDDKHFFHSSSLVTYLELQNVLNRGNVAQYIYADHGDINTVYQFRIFFVGGIRYEF
ncbi:MAG: TonB-dependent receptor [bacterium]